MNVRACYYCERTLNVVRNGDLLDATWDHVIPRSKGGSNRMDNMVRACRECNTMKGDVMPEVWSAALALFPNWWEKPGGAVELGRHLQSLRPDTEATDWPWLKELRAWNANHSTKEASCFFE